MQTNARTDEYSTHPDDVLRLLHRIVTSIRAVVPQNFILGMKLNVSDYVDTGPAETQRARTASEVASEDRALGHIRTIALWGGVDFLEISGGDYEKPGADWHWTLPETYS